MSPTLSFFCHGKPAPGGSKTVFPVWKSNGRGGWELVLKWMNGRPWPIFRITDDAGKGNKTWRAAVAAQARAWMQSALPVECGVKVEFIFFLKRPQSHFRTGKFSHILRDDAPKYHLHAPDALKFARSTEDALTGIVWKDDATNVRICSEKRYCGPEDKEGCAIRLVLLDRECRTDPDAGS